MSGELFTPFEVDSDLDIRDSEGDLICLQASCASDDVMIHIVHCVNNHERLVSTLKHMADEFHRLAKDYEYASAAGDIHPMHQELIEMADGVLAQLEAGKGGE